MEQYITQIEGAAAVAIVGILVAIIKALGDSIVGYIESKKGLLEKQKEKVVKETTVTERELLKTVGKDVWAIVEEEFRTKIKPIAETKIEMFNRLLLEKVPGLTQSQIDSVRQAIAGEVNKGKQVIVTDEVLTDTNLKLQEENANLLTENADLKKQLEQIQTLVTGKIKEPTN